MGHEICGVRGVRRIQQAQNRVRTNRLQQQQLHSSVLNCLLCTKQQKKRMICRLCLYGTTRCLAARCKQHNKIDLRVSQPFTILSLHIAHCSYSPSIERIRMIRRAACKIYAHVRHVAESFIMIPAPTCRASQRNPPPSTRRPLSSSLSHALRLRMACAPCALRVPTPPPCPPKPEESKLSRRRSVGRAARPPARQWVQ